MAWHGGKGSAPRKGANQKAYEEGYKQAFSPDLKPCNSHKLLPKVKWIGKYPNDRCEIHCAAQDQCMIAYGKTRREATEHWNEIFRNCR